MASNVASSTKKQQSTFVKAYLTAYNAASAVAWTSLLIRAVQQILDKGSNAPFTAYKDYGELAAYVQTTAILEVIHAILGLVQSGIFTTAMQVASRLFIIHAVCRPQISLNYHVPDCLAWITMIFAWSITEVIRYNFYALNIWGIKSNVLIYFRYTLFYVLYPLGAGSEWILLLRSLNPLYKAYGFKSAAFHYVLAIFYPYGLFIMMSHMANQRKKALGISGKPSKNQIKPKIK